MTAIEITRDDVRNGLKALVDVAGEDFVYVKKMNDSGSLEACLYVHEGKADCIVGQFLAAQGVPLDRLAEADAFQFGGGQPASCLIDHLEDEGVIKVDGGVRYALAEAQYIQDAGAPWGDALKRAQHELNHYEARVAEGGQR